ncbi:uncharacterized protein MYCFIDRAFT_187513 [Pseudocercospora fijiensis CIRAD86]|uniref:ribonuclease T1 n=1 Tax=Pseudocercospora fijiensis (strain CIRAD86) TaxID=383855 RepID=M3B5A4_PSEFD|nr:uncharacterized protein MYCFIDRAFT_187513 [Pseudocercospora fijiensis CIRAD86]EME84542.1 hypothetical protein MYCFIDRAFT_187513 [Pseudocercospora fijiensis CIRAD86]
MRMRFSFTSTALLFAVSSIALPTGEYADAALDKRQSATTCGSYAYSSSRYNNYEGFDFPVSGPYQEFPILPGSPGPDRVVFDTGGQYAGAITHTGASGNNFVGCSGTS